MALTFEESSQLMNNVAFRGRVKVACLGLARNWIAQPTPGQGMNARIRWAQACVQNPEMTAQNTTPTTVMQDAVQSQGADVDDSTLAFSVGQAVDSML